MADKINGRTPEEIKKGLADSIEKAGWDIDCGGASDLLWSLEKANESMIDALALIQQLENHIGELTEMVQQLESAQPKWISVEERLPEENFEVLMLFKHNMAVGWYSGEDDWYSNTDDGFYASCDGTPSHWMPLPEAPKEET